MEQLVFVTEKGTARTTLGFLDASFLDGRGRYEDEEHRAFVPRFPPPYQPTEASLYLTAACNLCCRYCYIAPFIDSGLRKSLSTEEWKSIMQDLEACGVRVLRLLGGEVLLRKDLAELIRYGEELGFDSIELATNGTLEALEANEAALTAFRSLRVPHVVSVSLDSVTPAYNDQVRGKHEQVLSGIRFLRGLGLSVSLAMVVTMENYDQIDPIAALAENLGISSLQFNDLIPIFPHQRASVIGDPALRVRLVAQIEALKRTCRNLVIVDRLLPAPNLVPGLFEKYAASPLVASSSLAGCPAATREAYVLPDGRLVACPMFMRYEEHLSARSIKGGSFQAVWESDPAIARFRSLRTSENLSGACSTCKLRPACKGGCRAMAFYLDGSLSGQDPRCLVATEKSAAL